MTSYGPPARWFCQFRLHPQVIEDKPRFEAEVRMQYEAATKQATEEGYELDGKWELEQHPLVYVPEWGEHGGYVAPDIARSVGVLTAPTLVECIALCGARKIIDP